MSACSLSGVIQVSGQNGNLIFARKRHAWVMNTELLTTEDKHYE